jgi:hypothetical protein
MFSNYEIRTNVACWDEKWVSAPNSLDSSISTLVLTLLFLKALHHPSFRKPPDKEEGATWDRG